MKMGKQVISPERAKLWLATNASNRSVRKPVVGAYARAMLAGKWMEDVGEPITFDEDGNLTNGQHRLLACVMANCEFVSWVKSDVPLAAVKFMDRGIRRTFTDDLKMAGVVRASTVASIVTRIASLERSGDKAWADTSKGGLSLNNIERHARRDADVAGFDRAAQFGKQFNDRTRGLLPGGLAGSLHYLFERADEEGPEDAFAFFEALATGEGLAADSPILLLREQLYQRQGKARMLARDMAGLTAKAFDAWRRGAPMRRLVFRAGGAKPEPFPSVGLPHNNREESA